MGSSDQKVYWDRVLGQSVAYKENFRMIFELSNGHIVEYRGTATAEVLEAEPMDREKVAGDISKEIQKMQIPDTSVRVVDEGVTISLENIQFQPDSAVPLPGEIEKLKKIGQILQQYPDRDIVVSGHTAMAGTEAGRKELSLERARMIADYLIQNGIRNPQQVIIRGYGAEKPLADNSTEEGRKKNRRVEITILEN
jgi:outer membrane protein OmpA-like peptidoglycan-associated protein